METDINFLLAHLDRYLVWAGVLACLALIIWLFRWRNRKRALAEKRVFLKGVFDEAIRQKAPFDLKLKNSQDQGGLSATLESISTATLNLQAQGIAGEQWNRQQIEVYLRVNQDGAPVFYVFESIVRNVVREGENSRLQIAIPAHLRVDKKRHFIRAMPPQEDILMLAVWAVAPGRRLPRSNTDLGKPLLAWKAGGSPASIRIENISGGGLALRCQVVHEDGVPAALEKGRQLICLLAYRNEAGERVIFWSTGEIMNARQNGDGLTVGLEFTNWAVQEPGSAEIRWKHSSPWQGAEPVLDWVKHLEKI
ncbi:MAG: PilZ domain-containing protein [Desulfovibrio sp.]|nr:PilZ domain-containing protein [Desulfovibrio sp.]